MARFQEMIHRMKPDDKKARFDTPLSGAIEIGVNEESDGKGQVVHIPLVFEPEALALWMVQPGGRILLGHANDVVP